MKSWIQKFLVASVAVVTLGVITPSHTIWNNILDSQASAKSQSVGQSDKAYTQTVYSFEEVEKVDLIAEAKEQSYQKFGSRIGPKIQNDFDEMIFPKMQEAIDETIAQHEEIKPNQLAITEDPSGNYAEKIFNIYNLETGKDLIRFHVRTENRPQVGYYYNFHYHTSTDNFVTHHNLGDVYWSKNTPPKWLS
ncbi:MAG: YpjP family protein [Kurthia sp.]|nr:YpjP family protein [Candidatus Kurthia equi]